MESQTDSGLKVGVIGASGIGQHHARWHTLCGSRVVGFVGSSDTSVARTAARLRDYFGFSGRGYTSVTEMLEVERPDIVAVTSSYSLHKSHALEAIASGAHVLCEKPLVWDESHSLDKILENGREIIRAAEASDALFEMAAQYPACIPMYRELQKAVDENPKTVDRIEMDMEVKRRGERKLFESNWIDVASHPLSMVIALVGLGEVDTSTAACSVEETESTASFRYEGAEGVADVAFSVRDVVEGPPLRRFGVNGFLADWDGFAGSDGVYRAKLTHQDQSVEGEDFLHTMIRTFTQSVQDGKREVTVGSREALLNLEMQVELLRIAREGADAA